MLRKTSLLLTVLVLIVPAGAGAYQLDGERSEAGREITYFNTVGEHDWAVERAVRAWNASGAQVEFVPASRGEAEVVISGGVPGFDGRTETTFHDGGPRPGDARVSLPSPSVARGRDGRFKVALIAAHELGHVLRLDHDDTGCALMNSTIVNDAPARCSQPPAGKWRCGLVEEDDVRGAVALYGGERRPSRRRFCPRVPPKPRPEPPRPPGGPDALSSAGALEVFPSPTRPGRVVVRWLNADGERIRSSVVARSRGSCPRKPSDGESRTVPAEPGAPGETTFALELARSCYAVWSRDRSGRLSRRPVIAWLDGPSAPEPPASLVARPTLSHALGDTGVSLEWRNAGSGSLREVIIARAEGRCPTRSPRRSRSWNSPPALPGSFQEHVDLGFYPAGGVERFCYAAWSRDRFGRLSRPVTAWPRRQVEEEGAIILAG